MPTSDKDTRFYVIGDIHGRLDLLNQLIDEIERDAKQHTSDCLTVTLGDYIDRGPDSRGVIDRLLSNPFPGQYVALKGNHEALLFEFLANPEAASVWRNLGGLATLQSFGITVPRLIMRRDYHEVAERLRASLSPEQMNFLTSLKTSFMVDRYFFCHAGVRPGIALERQREVDLLWIRDAFLNSRRDFGKIVVHGHTPVAEPEILPNRINIDTGAFATGRLTCLVLEDGKPRFIST